MNERIKQIRRLLDLTQQEFADRIKVKRNTVATYELGRSEPSDAAISLICKEFNVNERWLRTGEGEMFLQMTRDEEIAAFIGGALAKETDSFKKRFISMLARLKESDWEVLERMVAGIKKD
ncbi:helix-turn-helix domain-containing protein [Anaerotruncus colihominis]|uniref:helix-turn-helix domain-containing protein n=1 Tax=Anaerotruncus colihominis TaxID=169435 RepID=UPI001749BE83|nr:helix-turn-helix transcriptional regulator [Anaerotruncus colihominis]